MYQKYVCKIFVVVSNFYIFKLLFKIQKKIKNVDKKLESITNIPCVVSETDCKKYDKKIKLRCSKSCGTDEFTLFTNDFLHIRSYQNDISILKNMYAKDWVYDKEILELEESMSLATALELMNEKKNTCALLYDEKYNLVGILDTPDVLYFKGLCVFGHEYIKGNKEMYSLGRSCYHKRNMQNNVFWIKTHCCIL